MIKFKEWLQKYPVRFGYNEKPIEPDIAGMKQLNKAKRIIYSADKHNRYSTLMRIIKQYPYLDSWLRHWYSEVF